MLKREKEYRKIEEKFRECSSSNSKDSSRGNMLEPEDLPPQIQSLELAIALDKKHANLDQNLIAEEEPSFQGLL